MIDGPSFSLTRAEAERVMESLRKGIPPPGYVRAFTVGRRDELAELEESMHSSGSRGTARLIRANYGSGKSHLLRVIREMALDSGYAVSFITMDASGGVRGNRMDQLYGAFCRNIEVPGTDRHGLRALFDAVAAGPTSGVAGDLRKKILTRGYFPSPLKVWGVKNGLQNWVNRPDVWWRDQILERVQRGDDFRKSPRAGFYDECWSALADLHLITQAAGLRGLILLVDEYEDVIQNLRNRQWQQTAFRTLFDFFDGHRFPGSAYFAVTPEFSIKCRGELASRSVYDFPVARFDKLPYFEMSPVTRSDLQQLARIIRGAHATAYNLKPFEQLPDTRLHEVVRFLSTQSSQDQTRQVIKGIVRALDDAVDD